MKTITNLRHYLANEQALANSMPGSPEYQVFTMLLRLANTCTTVEEFLAQAREILLEGPHEETKEAKEWLCIALDTIEESE